LRRVAVSSSSVETILAAISAWRTVAVAVRSVSAVAAVADIRSVIPADSAVSRRAGLTSSVVLVESEATVTSEAMPAGRITRETIGQIADCRRLTKGEKSQSK